MDGDGQSTGGDDHHVSHADDGKVKRSRNLYIVGEHLPSGLQAQLGGVACQVKVLSATQATATCTPTTAGTQNLTLSNGNGQQLSGGQVSITVESRPADGNWSDDFATVQDWKMDYPIMLGDVNGDGKDDLVGFGQDGIYVGLSTGIGFETVTRWFVGFAYDNGWRIERHPRHLADINGDGLLDVVAFGENGTYVALSTGNAFVDGSRWTADFARNSGWDENRDTRILADANGDGLADIVGINTYGVQVSLSTGSGFEAASYWSRDFGHFSYWRGKEQPRVFADVNGDGKIDIIGFGEFNTNVGISTGSSFASSAAWTRQFSYSYGWRVNQHPREVVDLDGDGKADILGFGNNGIVVGLSGVSWGSSWLNDYGKNQGWNTTEHLRRSVNLNDDGMADILGIYDDKIVTHTSMGNGFGAKQVSQDAIVLNFDATTERRLIGDVTGDDREDIIIIKANGVYVLVANENGGYEK